MAVLSGSGNWGVDTILNYKFFRVAPRRRLAVTVSVVTVGGIGIKWATFANCMLFECCYNVFGNDYYLNVLWCDCCVLATISISNSSESHHKTKPFHFGFKIVQSVNPKPKAI